MAGHFSEELGPARSSLPPHESQNIDFYERVADRYSLFFHDFESSMRAEGEWLETVIGTSPLRVLDGCCGTGRQAIPLAMRGHRVTAADPCEAMLAEAQRLSAEHRASLEFRQASFVDLGDLYPRQFDLVVAMGNGLCHLPGPAEILSALASLKRCLKAGGLCLVGIKDFEAILRKRHRLHPHGKVIIDEEQFVLLDVWSFHDPFLLSTTAFASIREPDKRENLGITCEYMLRRAELERLAGEAGFSDAKELAHPHEVVYRLSGLD